MKRVVILFVCMGLLTAVLTVRAQDTSSMVNNLAQEVERSILQKELGWRLKDKTIRSEKAANSKGQPIVHHFAIYQWAMGEDNVTFTMSYKASQQEAADSLNLSKDRVSTGLGRKLEGLGDEAYIWTWTTPQGTGATIHFRQSNVHVNLSASSRALAERFAKHIADAVNSK